MEVRKRWPFGIAQLSLKHVFDYIFAKRTQPGRGTALCGLAVVLAVAYNMGALHVGDSAGEGQESLSGR